MTAIMSSIGAKKTAKTAAIMHLLFNVIGTIIFSVAAIFFFKVLNPGMGATVVWRPFIAIAASESPGLPGFVAAGRKQHC